MKFVAISDTHGQHEDVILPKGDVLIHAGDVSRGGLEYEIEDFLAWFSQQNFEHKIFIAGNHDFFFERKPGRVAELIPENVTYLYESSITINGVKIWGSPFTPWFHNWAFNRHRGPEIAKHWEYIPQDANIIITHGPVYGILDKVLRNEYVGCVDLLKKVQEIKPNVHICGHIHEGYGQKSKDGILFINASVVNSNYRLSNKPVLFEL